MTMDNASQDASQSTAGERLRKAREVAGLSVAEVAAKQHLRPAIISAIESGDYRSIDSELFLKGYVRAYASHVGLDPDGVVRQLDSELEPLREEQKARVEDNPLVTIERRKRRKRRIARVVVLLLVLGALAYVGSMYLTNGDLPSMMGSQEQVEDESTGNDTDQPAGEGGQGATEAAEASPTPEPEESEAELSDSVDQPSGMEEVTEATEETASAEAGSSSADAVVPDPQDASVSNSTATDPDDNEPVAEQPAGGTEAISSESDNDAVTTTVSTETDTGSEPATTTTASSEGRLVVEFSADCWVEVQNSAGRTLVAELRRAGETLEVNGDGPLRVVLGAVSAVSELRYSGETVSLSDRRTRNDRLVLNLPD